MNLEDLQKLCDAASPGPWQFRATQDSGGIQFVVAPNAKRTAQGFEFIAADCSHKCNGEFIAAARDYMPILLEIAKAAEVYREFLPMKDVTPDDVIGATKYSAMAMAAIALHEALRKLGLK